MVVINVNKVIIQDLKCKNSNNDNKNKIKIIYVAQNVYCTIVTPQEIWADQF